MVPSVLLAREYRSWIGKGVRATDLLRLLLVASVAGPALIFGLLAVLTYRAAFADARREITQTSEVAREHASKVFDSFRLVTDRVEDLLDGRDDAAIRNAEGLFHAKIGQIIADLPQVQSIVVIDRGGRALVATGAYPVNRGETFSDRDYFQALEKGAPTFISRVQKSRITGETFFGWGRARKDGDGAFAGVIDIAVSPDFFMRFYETLSRETGRPLDGRVVTMVRQDGQILARYPVFAGEPAQATPSSALAAAIRTNPDQGIYAGRSVMDPDAPERLFAYRKVPGHPVYMVAGRSTAAITAVWRRSMLRYLAVGFPGTLALIALTLATMRGARRERDALDQLRAEMGRRERVEDQLRQAQKMEAVGQLTGGIAHDFNNLLTIIRSSIDLLRRPGLPEDRQRRYIEAISDTTTRATKLTGQLLAFARRQALKPEVFDVGANVRAIVEMVRSLAGSRIAVETRFPELPCHVNADPSQFDTALVNMAVNARDAMNGEGRLVIGVGAVRDVPAQGARPVIPGEFVAVSISDTGTGIAAEHLGRIFEPFFTTKAVGSGTGLGLSQVLGFSQQSGGDIRLDSEVGRGTTFTLYLPRVPAPTRVAEMVLAPDLAAIDGRGTCVLVVEDNPDVGEAAVQTLNELGYASVRSRDAEEALAELSKDPSRFDVVFSDVVMPGMNGIEFGHEVRSRFANLPVVLASGYSDVLAQSGSFGFELLQKPYSIEQLSRALDDAIRKDGRREGADADPTAAMPPG